MCGFHYLYNGEDGYVVRCRECGHYQLAFASVMLTLTEDEFRLFGKLVKYKYDSTHETLTESSKSIVLPTPAPGISVLLTKNEAARLCAILEEADNENKALMLISLFNS